MKSHFSQQGKMLDFENYKYDSYKKSAFSFSFDLQIDKKINNAKEDSRRKTH